MAKPTKVPKAPVKPRLVLIHWHDAAGLRDGENLKPIDCLSVGWVVEISDKDGHPYIKLASELMEDNEHCEHIVIPAGMVRQIVKLPKRTLPGPFSEWQFAAKAPSKIRLR